MQIRKLTMQEREMSAWLNEDYHAYNKIKALESLQSTNLEMIKEFGDKNDELIIQANSQQKMIDELKDFIIMRRQKKEKMFEKLSDELQEVMIMHYLSYLTFEEISERLNYHVSSVKRKHIYGLEILVEGGAADE